MSWRCALAAGLLAATCAADGWAQSVLARSPNLHPAWELAPGSAALRLGHRFEIISGGDQLLNVPTMTLGVGLPWRASIGLDVATNSEIVPAKTGGNELQLWLGAPLLRGERAGADAVVAWNSAARSLDAALTLRGSHRGVSLLGELRGFQDALGTGSSGAAAALGLVARVTPYLELSGDVGRMLSPDSLDTVWSAGVAVALPGTPHTLALQVTNGGVTTLQGASRDKVLGPQALRYGFVFTLPLGAARWARIFRRDRPGQAPDTLNVAARVTLRMIALAPREVRIRVGDQVAWINRDPLVHTVTADDGTWGSGEMAEGAVFVHRFDRPGRYTYHCIPHPQMRGVVIVE